MRKYFTIIFFLFSLCSVGQITINGKILNVENNEPIAGANVFINNTSYKTVTNTEGKFEFLNLNIQRGELVINALGFKYDVVSINNKTEKNITVLLKPQAKELDAITVTGYEKDGFKKWGKLFLDGFIGTTHESADCKIENTKALKFYFNKKNGELSVVANDPLKIINKALGYQIDYTLELFQYDTKGKILFYSGYPVFSDLLASKKKIRQWKEKRNECYKGSVMHFMRALYSNKIKQEGFVVQKATKSLNEKKAAYKKKLQENILNQQKNNTVITFSNNLSDNDRNLMREPDSVFTVFSQILPTDSFAFAIDSLTAGMYFENYLIISYTIEKNTTVSSFVKLILGEPLSIFHNGSYYNPLSFFTERYWAESEKTARMLPFNFVLEK